MPISDCEVRDPRIRRTRQLLQGALQTLMQTRSFEEISVQEIAEAATVNRATFYDHYTDKFALLEALIAGGFHKLLFERQVHYNPNCPTAASTLILAVCDYFVLMHQGSGCKSQDPFEPLIDAAITGAIRRVISRDMERRNKESVDTPGLSAEISPEIIATAASSAIYAAAKAWFHSAKRPPVEEIVPQILSLILPMLEKASQLCSNCSGESAESANPLASTTA